MKYHCKKCGTEFTEIRQPIVVCQECGLVQLVPYSYRPKREMAIQDNYETRFVKTND